MLRSQLPPALAEGINGALFFDLSFALMLFASYIVYEVRRDGDEARASAATAVSVLLLGDMILRGWFWLWRIQFNNGVSTAWMDDVPIVPLGQIVVMAGVLCVIRVFSPVTWPRDTWIAIGLMSVLLAVAASYVW